MKNSMMKALGQLSGMVKMYFPADMKQVLLDYGAEIDRLRAEVDELRSKIERE